MLSKQDLNQFEKLVRKIVREEVAVESRSTRDDLQSEIKLARMELSLRLDKIDDKVKNLEIRLSQFQANTEKELKKIGSNIARLRKDLNTFTMSFDQDRAHLQKRIMRIESRLGLVNQQELSPKSLFQNLYRRFLISFFAS